MDDLCFIDDLVSSIYLVIDTLDALLTGRGESYVLVGCTVTDVFAHRQRALV